MELIIMNIKNTLLLTTLLGASFTLNAYEHDESVNLEIAIQFIDAQRVKELVEKDPNLAQARLMVNRRTTSPTDFAQGKLDRRLRKDLTKLSTEKQKEILDERQDLQKILLILSPKTVAPDPILRPDLGKKQERSSASRSDDDQSPWSHGSESDPGDFFGLGAMDMDE